MSTTYVEAVQADSPLVWYRDNTTDASGNGNNGSSNGTLQFLNTGGPLNGQASGYLNFPGSGWVTNASLSNYPNGRSSVSWECWVKYTGGGSYNDVWIWDNVNAFGINVDAGTVNFYTGNSAGSAGTINDGSWHYIACVYDGTLAGGTATLYIDGVSENVVAGIGATLSSSDTGLELSAGNDAAGDAGEFFTGRGAEFAVYPQALSAARVLAHYTAGTTAPPSASATTVQNWFMGYDD